MASPKISMKHVQLDKANKAVIIATSLAVVVLVFGGFIGRGVWLRFLHQERVIIKKEEAKTNLETNIEARNEIVDAYNAFLLDGSSPGRNIIGGNFNSQEATEAFLAGEDVLSSSSDGDNAKIILDALPSKYDFPALATTIERILLERDYKIESIEGTDDEVNQANVPPSPNPVPVEMPIGVIVEESNYEGVVAIVNLLQASIRPFNIQTLNINGDSESLSIELDMLTYYQPEKILGITEEAIK